MFRRFPFMWRTKTSTSSELFRLVPLDFSHFCLHGDGRQASAVVTGFGKRHNVKLSDMYHDLWTLWVLSKRVDLTSSLRLHSSLQVQCPLCFR